jgi:transposase-like protein
LPAVIQELGLRGRPTLYKPEFCDQLIEQMAEGLSFMAAMARIGVSRQTGYSWVKQHEEFLEAFELGKGKRLLFLERRLLSARSHGVVTSLAPQHSVIECRRYLNRFAMYLGEPMIELTMLIHTKYNEYDAVIRPMEAYLEKKGVRFRKGTRVRDIETVNKGKETLATALVYDDDSGRQRIALTRDDLVFFTNGSMVQKTTWGDNDTVVSYDRDTSDLGLFDVWKKGATP